MLNICIKINSVEQIANKVWSNTLIIETISIWMSLGFLNTLVWETLNYLFHWVSDLTTVHITKSISFFWYLPSKNI